MYWYSPSVNVSCSFLFGQEWRWSSCTTPCVPLGLSPDIVLAVPLVPWASVGLNGLRMLLRTMHLKPLFTRFWLFVNPLQIKISVFMYSGLSLPEVWSFMLFLLSLYLCPASLAYSVFLVFEWLVKTHTRSSLYTITCVNMSLPLFFSWVSYWVSYLNVNSRVCCWMSHRCEPFSESVWLLCMLVLLSSCVAYLLFFRVSVVSFVSKPVFVPCVCQLHSGPSYIMHWM